MEALERSPIGTGASSFVEWVIGSHVNLVRNEEYWGTVPSFENLTVRFIVDDTARMVALETGEVDIVFRDPVGGYRARDQQ